MGAPAKLVATNAVSTKIKTLKVAHILRAGGLLGHTTSTLAGVAASANSARGIQRVQRFKQRKAPFLLLADSVSTALKQAVMISPALRKLAKQSWPGSVTLVFPATQVLAKACYQQGHVAIRVDNDEETRRLAKYCGGLLLSSSLNRKGKAVEKPNHKLRFRWKRYLAATFHASQQSQGKASQIFKISGHKIKQLR